MVPGTFLELAHFIASQKVAPRFLFDDVTQVSRCRWPRSWQCCSRGCGCCRCLFYCRSFCSLTVHGSFRSQESELRNDSNTCICSCFLPAFVRPTSRIAASGGTVLRLLSHCFLPLWASVQQIAKIGRLANQTEARCRHHRATKVIPRGVEPSAYYVAGRVAGGADGIHTSCIGVDTFRLARLLNYERASLIRPFRVL